MKDADHDKRGSRTGKSRKARDPTLDTKVAHRVLLEALDQVREILETESLSTKTEVGTVLSEIDDSLHKILDSIKEELRAETMKQLDGRVGTHTFLGDDLGEASVLVPNAVLRVPKGKDMEEIRLRLGSQFSLFFEEVTTFTPRKEYEERVVAVSDPVQQQILFDAVERVELTPRVSFKRNRPSRAATAEE
jgi:hypothetical protein